MAGTIRGLIEQNISNVGVSRIERASVIFTNLYNLFVSHPGVTIVALSYGSGGTGTDYYDGAAPFGDNAFFVARMEPNAGRAWPYYIFVKVGGTLTSAALTGLNLASTGGGVPAAGAGAVLFQTAVGIGGDLNPWNGTTNADGSDTHPAQIWKIPVGGSNVIVLPSRNRGGGADGVNKNSAHEIYYFHSGMSDSSHRYHFLMDDDNFIVAYNLGNPNYYQTAFILAFEPNPNISVYPTPLLELSISLSGSFNPNGFDRQGGLANPNTSDMVRQSLEVEWNNPPGFSASFQPNVLAGGAFDAYPYSCWSGTSGLMGLAGHSDFIGTVMGIPTHGTDLAMNWTVIGSPNTGDSKLVVPWDGATLPGSGLTREGIAFTRAP